MIKRLLVVLAFFSLVAAACGSGAPETDASADPTTSTDEAAENDGSNDDSDASADDAMGDGAGEDANDDMTDGSGDADAGMTDGSDDMGDGNATGSTEPGSADDRSLVESDNGEIGALLFADTIDSPEAPTSARFEARMSITAAPEAEVPGTFEITMAGAFDVPADASELSIDMSELLEAAAAAESEEIPPGFEDYFADPIRIITIGDMGWMQWSFLSLFTGQTDGWIELDADEVDDTTEGFGFSSSAGDPIEALEDLAGADARLTDLGVEEINGVVARHWQALANLEQLSADATPEERADLEARYGDLSETEFPVDIWIGVDDGLIYRYMLEFAGAAFLSESDGEVESATMAVDFFDYNEDQGIAPPPAEEIIDGESLFGA